MNHAEWDGNEMLRPSFSNVVAMDLVVAHITDSHKAAIQPALWVDDLHNVMLGEPASSERFGRGVLLLDFLHRFRWCRRRLNRRFNHWLRWRRLNS